jgi:hypothetical protein
VEMLTKPPIGQANQRPSPTIPGVAFHSAISSTGVNP